MIYSFLLAVLPIVVVIFLWSDDAPAMGDTVKTLLSAVLLVLAASGFIDSWGEENEAE